MKGSNRWPPIFALGLTAVLVFLVLPNPLRVPQNNPAAQAEFAPVPGKREQSSASANFGETNQASSEGIGSGGDSGIGGPPPPPPPTDFIYKPSNKNCVGDPPRQTEDPLSPPCVPFFDGDNKGSTWRGVTGDTIKVVLYNDLNVEGDMTKPWKVSDEQADHETSQNGQQTYLVRTIKGLLSFFTQRYQTYGRRVELIAVPSQNGLTSTCSQRATDATTVNRKHQPFAVVHFGDGGQCFLTEMAEKYQVPGFGLNADVPRKLFEDVRPYTWGFFPDQETEASYSASFICRKLFGRKAKFANSPTLQELTRKFGLIFPTKSQRGPESAELADLLMRFMQQDKACAGIKIGKGRENDVVVRTIANDGKAEASGIMTDFVSFNVTTIICYCVPVQTENTVTTMQTTAQGLNYYPEWYWDHASRMFRAIWNELFNNDAMSSFGTSYHWRNDSFKEQYWYRAYLTQWPGTIPNTRFGFDIYHLFLNLYQGLQGAGPQLTPESVERGMFTFNYLDRTNFFGPIGGYGPYDRNAVSSYTFIDTGMAFYWDPTGTPPGENNPKGCLRAVRDGRRYYAGEWPEGDDDLFQPSSPCYQDDTKILKSGPGDF
ncbi:MAG: hypothetical protein ACLGH3_03235 [Actinomycetota bacterium]